MANITPNNCTVFVQLWVDVNGLQQGTTRGCYAVSNRSQQSTGEGTANLTTKVITGSNVCWSVVPIDPQYNQCFAITNIGVQSGWSQPPQVVPGKPNVFTGQLTQSTVSGNVNSNIEFSYNQGGQSITVKTPVTIIPVSA
jgi:hypothetical protein